MKIRNLLGVFLLLLSVCLAACSNTDEEAGKLKTIWEYESLKCEAYTANGGNPYVVDGQEHKVCYPLGKLITRDEMKGEESLRISFGTDGVMYVSFGSSWEKVSSYRKEGNYLFLEEGNAFFFPMNQTLPPGFGATEVVNEILEWSDSSISIRLVQTDAHTGTRVISTNNLRRVTSDK